MTLESSLRLLIQSWIMTLKSLSLTGELCANKGDLWDQMSELLLSIYLGLNILVLCITS